MTSQQGRWQFWIDRGGTFTDVVAQRPDGSLTIHKLLSENPDRYSDAPLQGIREVMGLPVNVPLPTAQIAAIKMGTTVATNALLERKGDRTVLLITQGFRDALRIGYQNRPNIFARQIILPEMLYERVIEVEERCTAQGEILAPLHPTRLTADLQIAYNAGIRACAIVLMHGYRYPAHEQQVADLAKAIGFTQISVSHRVSPLMKLVSRGDTTVVDAYLSPILRRYVDRIAAELQQSGTGYKPALMFMQSNGGLTDASLFQGKDSILSGPAGGIVGAVQTSARAGFDKIIGFDMGGTSTDVSHFNGEYERVFETEVAGVRLRAPMMSIHTVAAGGGSILQFDGARYRVGPQSAGAHPGPACYRKGGPLTVTDCNVMLGRIQPQFFPQVFGQEGNQPIDFQIVQQQFTHLAAEIAAKTGSAQTPQQVAEGFLTIAIDKMATAIKKISIQRGYDVAQYTLCCFGGAGGQHACRIADALGIRQVFLHPYAGVLSAYGMGLADISTIREQAIEARLTDEVLSTLTEILNNLTAEAHTAVQQQGILPENIRSLSRVHLRYEGTDSALVIDFGDRPAMLRQYESAYQQRYGFVMKNKPLIVEAVSVEAIGKTTTPTERVTAPPRTQPLYPTSTVQMYTGGQEHNTPVYLREQLCAHDRLLGPALLIEATSTNVIEPGWLAVLTENNHLLLQKQTGVNAQRESQIDLPLAKPDPVLLEIFNNLVRSIAEEMGVTLQNTSYSVNIKERLDFSCAIFDRSGQLVANAPHIPVHLGSMSESVQSLMTAKGNRLKPGDVYVQNNPYNGGTHLPDITVITPVFLETNTPQFYVASRGHHADIGGITPGSMPPHSQTIEQEGILIDNFLLVEQGQFREAEMRQLLNTEAYPARNPDQNIADLQAQVAANERGVQELRRMVSHYGLETVQTYMQFVQDNAAEAVRRVLSVLQDGSFTYPMDDGTQIQVKVTIDRPHRTATVDFTGTSPQQPNNLNAPLAICKAVVLYVFRTLVEDDIPLNAGCLQPLTIVVPEGSLLNPHYPAAVVAGNVETSQAIANALYGALGVMAAAQGTMNNFTFGNDRYQYYETICGGSGAGKTFDGTDAVQTHMTNSRLTDPEVLEWRFPVLLENFAIRTGSGGTGTHQGGNGVIRCLQFRESMTAAILSSHRVVSPFGLAGGQPGAIGRNSVVRSTGETELLSGRAEVTMNPGDQFRIETPGGGGYGNPSN
ncbi:hydantoinase B/oxoprolinase family protein [Leptolyngbya sp. FACHB-711]|uniref:hydantoinase B/oxoprolinase family protein n=1 Tax=unclassified Leptolyngbya TaxID=2650499 RepID=UPI001686F5BC|nr:hydantoinase B/oxoprolinase family protein [Leptolyngbya sp. FACHB-711]MBD1850178.1 hydantoinase B/oxoprolinase family protein [Cyanobacteria bacterium FACHB-502]MBD2023440.1 hydantoinase B/oxoprolinase family protein [Leptolyngbya sp. FACHB-711]